MDAKSHEAAKSASKKYEFRTYERRQAEINEAVGQEHTRHEAALENMDRLRSLRLQRDAGNAAQPALPLDAEQLAKKRGVRPDQRPTPAQSRSSRRSPKARPV